MSTPPSSSVAPPSSSSAAASAAALTAAPKIARVGPYKLGKTLGIGSFCKVKLGTHELTGQKVAIKILNRKKLKKLDMGEKVRTEIHILRLFTHPHIIRLYEVIDTPTDIFTVMEYVPNGELFEYIVSRGKLDEQEARSLFQQIISGVEYCHVHSVVHRDLKPENLLLDADNKIKLADFGLSNRMKDGQFLKTSCGSPNYAAPEVISGNLYCGPEVDVWSCGVILYALLCGSLPFDDENIRALFRKIKGGIYTIPSHVTPGARDLLSKMLLVDPIKRITVPQIMAHSWYRQYLPLYLSLSAEQQIAQTQAIDEQTLMKVVSMGFARDRVLKALSVGHELLTSRKYANQTEARKMAVIYNLLRDQKLRKQQNKDDFVDQGPSPPKDSANNVTDPTEDITKMSPFAQLTHKALVAQHTIHQNEFRASPSAPNYLSTLNLPYLGGRWQLGVNGRTEAHLIMNEIYKILKEFKFEWKVLSLYKLKARYPVNLIDPYTQQAVSPGQVCKVGIQLYKSSFAPPGSTESSQASTPSASPMLKPQIAPGTSPSSNNPQTIANQESTHVVDIQKLYGQMFLFLEFSAKICTQLSAISIGSTT